MTKYVRRAEIRKTRSRAGLALGLAGTALSVLALGFIWQRVYLGQTLSLVERLTAANRELQVEGKALLLESQRINSWSAVERTASERLGMTYPEKHQLRAAVTPPSGRKDGLGALARGLLRPVNEAWSQP